MHGLLSTRVILRNSDFVYIFHKIYMHQWEKYNMKLDYLYVKQGNITRFLLMIYQLFVKVLCVNYEVRVNTMEF